LPGPLSKFCCVFACRANSAAIAARCSHASRDMPDSMHVSRLLCVTAGSGADGAE
jgi:hypothetical protein